MTRPLLGQSVVLVPVILLAAACSSPTQPAAPLDARVTVEVGRTVAVDGSGLGLRFDAVTEDSRCPADANCVWVGRAVAALTLVDGTREVGVELKTEPASARAALARGVRLELVELEPYPFGSRPIRPDEYRITVRVVR